MPLLLRAKGINYSDPWYVCIAPGSGRNREFKRWPAERYAELAIRLRRDASFTTPFVFVFGPSEAALKETIRRALEAADQPVYLIDHLDVCLETLAALYQRALLVISNDSAPLQIARVTGTWALAISGPTSPLYHRFRADGRHVLLYPPEGAVCDGRGHVCSSRERTQCLNLISVEYAYQHAAELLNRSILLRKIDRFVKDSGGQVKRFLDQTVEDCRPHLEKEAPLLEEDLRCDEKPMGERVRDRERLMHVYLLLGRREEFRREFGLLMRERRQAGLAGDEWDVQLGAGDDEAAEIYFSTFDRLMDQESRREALIEGLVEAELAA